MNPPELPEGWSYEYAELAGQPNTRARHPAGRATFWQPGTDGAAHEAAAAIAVNLAGAISARLISARRSATDRPAQLDMFAGLAAPQIAGPADGITSPRKHYNRGSPPRESQRAQHPHAWTVLPAALLALQASPRRPPTQAREAGIDSNAAASRNHKGELSAMIDLPTIVAQIAERPTVASLWHRRTAGAARRPREIAAIRRPTLTLRRKRAILI